jgi:hypothetical protein
MWKSKSARSFGTFARAVCWETAAVINGSGTSLMFTRALSDPKRESSLKDVARHRLGKNLEPVLLDDAQQL